MNWFSWLQYGYSSTTTLFPALFSRYMELILAPLEHKEMLWIVLPVTITLVVMELYFGVYSSEELGWNTATANSLFLVLVSFDLFRQLFVAGSLSFAALSMYPSLFAISGVLLLLGIVMLILNFTHSMPRHLAFKISSVLPVNIFAYLSVVVVYSNLSSASGGVMQGIPIDRMTAAAAVLLYISLFIIFGIVHMLEPHKFFD